MSDVKSEIQACEFNLERIESERKPLHRRLTELSREELQVNERIWELKYGLRVGCGVESGGALFQVTGVRHVFDPPWLRGRKRLKDGTWGNKDMSIYREWKVVKQP